MKQVIRRVIDRKGTVKVEEVPVPRPGAYDVLIDVRRSAISSGTEMATLNKTLPELVKQTINDPWMRQVVKNVMSSGGVLGTADRVHDELIAYRLIGYSGAGLVLETGDAVTGVAVGDRVAFSGQGHAELVCASRNQVVKVPQGLELSEAAFATVGAIALQGVRRAGVELGETIAVVGLGLIGQLAFQLAQAAGGHCIGVEPNASRRELARELGIGEVIDPAAEDGVTRVLQLTGGLGADRVLICASSSTNTEIANDALKMCRAQGRVAVLGLVPMHLERMPFFRRELDFVFSRAYGPGPMDADWERGRAEYPEQYVRWDAKRNMGAFMAQVRAGRVKVAPLITGTFPVEQAQRAYDAVYEGAMASLLTYEAFAGDLEATRKVPTRKRRWIRPIKRDAARVGFIGCGNFTRSVLLPELNKLSSARIHAIAAASGVNAKPMAEKYGATYVTTDPAELLADADVDAVIIATRHHLHAQLARQALEAGKHVLVEKPMALDAAEAVQLAELAESSGLHMIVGHNRRYAPLTRRLLASRPGGPAMMHYTVSIRPLPAGHWTLNKTEGGGRLLGESDHFFDMLNLFAASEPVSVSATAHASGDQEPHASCNFSVQVRYADGSAGTLLYTDLGHAEFPRERLEIFCGGSVLRLEDYARAEVLGGRSWTHKGKPEMGHAQELANFVDVVLGKGDPMATTSDGLAATLIAQAALHSIQGKLECSLVHLSANPVEDHALEGKERSVPGSNDK